MASLKVSKVHFLSILAFAALVGCNGETAGTGKTGTTVVTEPTEAEVVRKDLVGYIFFDGKVVTPAGVNSTVTSPYEISVSEVLTSVGKRVNRGETIIRLAVPSAKAAVDQAEANLAAAKSALAAANSANSSVVRDAQMALSQARADEKAARLDIQNGGTADLQAATDARVAAESVLREAQGQLNMMTVAERQDVAMAQEYLKDAKEGAAVANVRAPISGTIMSLEAKPGMQAKAKDQLATITDLQALRIQGTVPPEHADLVKKGGKILIALDGQNSDPVDGEVSEITVLPPSEGQTSAGYLAVIKFNNSKGLVTPASIIKRLGVRTGKVEQALVVPIGAITIDADGKATVRVQKGQEWIETKVEIGISDGALTEIKSGLKEGDTVRVNATVLKP